MVFSMPILIIYIVCLLFLGRTYKRRDFLLLMSCFLFMLWITNLMSKMVALKKAYAEMLLNTAKEAAARVMAAQRKAKMFEHDLNRTKEEALRMLLRFKQMLEDKVPFVFKNFFIPNI